MMETIPFNGRVTIRDVADAAQVSIATVSRALNGKPGVAPQTVEHVRSIADRLGFTPKLAAQELRRSTPLAVALLFPIDDSEVDGYDLDFVFGAAAAAADHGVHFDLHLEAVDQRSLVGLYRSGRIDGVVLMQVAIDDWRVQTLNEHQLPFTLIGRPGADAGVPSVDPDFDGSIRTAVEHLWDLGHRSVGLIGRPTRQIRAGLGAAVRIADAFVAHCARAGIDWVIVPSELDRVSAAHAAGRLIDESAVTAIVTIHALATAATYGAARERKLSIPDDLSVVAIGSRRAMEMLDPVPTAIAFSPRDLGYRATDQLVDLLQHPHARPPGETLVPAELILRSTTSRKGPR